MQSLLPILLMNPLAVLCIVTGALAGAYAAGCVYVAHRLTRARRRLPVAHPSQGDIERDQVHFPARDGRARIAAWYLPAAPRDGAVIFVHGRNGCRGDEHKAPSYALAEQLRRYGLTVLMIDLRGHGSSSAARLGYGLRECHDVLGAVDYLLERGHPPGRIGVLGVSMGGVAGLLAAIHEPALGAVVADSPYADFGALLAVRFRAATRVPRCVLPGALALVRWTTGLDPRSLRPGVDAAALCGRPVLVVHGEHDPLVPVEHGRAVARACEARLWVTASATHLGAYRDDPSTYSAVMLRFFTRHLMADPHHAISGLAEAPTRPQALLSAA